MPKIWKEDFEIHLSAPSSRWRRTAGAGGGGWGGASYACRMAAGCGVRLMRGSECARVPSAEFKMSAADVSGNIEEPPYKKNLERLAALQDRLSKVQKTAESLLATVSGSGGDYTDKLVYTDVTRAKSFLSGNQVLAASTRRRREARRGWQDGSRDANSAAPGLQGSVAVQEAGCRRPAAGAAAWTTMASAGPLVRAMGDKRFSGRAGRAEIIQRCRVQQGERRHTFARAPPASLGRHDAGSTQSFGRRALRRRCMHGCTPWILVSAPRAAQVPAKLV